MKTAPFFSSGSWFVRAVLKAFLAHQVPISGRRRVAARTDSLAGGPPISLMFLQQGEFVLVVIDEAFLFHLAQFGR